MREAGSVHAATWIRVGDRRVHRIGLGTNRVTDTPAARNLLRRAVELGVDFVDTADVYTSGASEETIGATLSSSGTGVLIATKGGMTREASGYGVDGRPAHLRAAVEKSLQRMRADRLELYQLHRVDPDVPLEESLSTLKEFQKEGRIRHIGISNVNLGELERAVRVVNVTSVQNRYNVLERDHEDVLRYCEQHEIAFIPWTPLGRARVAESEPVIEVARRRRASPNQIALAWLLRRSPVTLPIPGTLSEAHMIENLASANVELSPEDLRVLDDASPPRARG